MLTRRDRAVGFELETISPITCDSLAAESARAYHAELAAKEGAAEVVAAYLGRWNLAARCEWIHRDGGTVHMDERSLRVDCRDVWRCWWDAHGYVLTLRAEWLVAPWAIARPT